MIKHKKDARHVDIPIKSIKQPIQLYEFAKGYPCTIETWDKISSVVRCIYLGAVMHMHVDVNMYI